VFAIAFQQQQYKTYTLSDQTAQSQLEVIPERGGIVTSWRVQGKELFYLDAKRLEDPKLSVRGGIPILFPICGNLVNDTYTYKGQSYTLKQHGFARDLPWEVTDSVTANSVSLTLVLGSNEQTLAVYPFDFQLAFTYQLSGNSLEIRQRCTNLSSEPMPFAVGIHPYFEATDKTQLHCKIPATQFQTKQSQTLQPFDGTFDFDRDEIDVAFQQLSDRVSTVTDSSRQLELKLDWDDTYSTLVFWTVKGKNFYCLEPWSAPRNALNTGEHLIHLEPGASHDAFIRMTATFK